MRTIRSDFVTLFILAGLLALVAVPLKLLFWVPGSDEILTLLPVPQRDFWHGHELLAGYGQLVLGGYLLTRPGKRTIRFLIMLWLVARISIFVPGLAGLYLGAFGNLATFGLLFFYAGLAFFRAAKRLKSALPGLIIFLLLSSEAVFQAGGILANRALSETALLAMIWLLIVLLFLMGGRIIAAATSGALQKRDMYRPYMAQGRLENYGLSALILAAVSDLAGLPPPLSALLGLLAAMVIMRRLWNWRVWLVADGFDLTSLHLGYAMLAVGLCFNSVLTLILGRQGLIGFHGAMIGGFALLSITVMCRTVLQRFRFSLSLPVSMRISCACVAVASLTRMAAIQDTGTTELLVMSALLWELAFAGFVFTLIALIWRFKKTN
ncbi:NnrS family protein [Thalassospira sp. SM2505]